MAFAMEHKEEPPDSIWNTEHGNDFAYQPWTMYKSNLSQSIAGTKGLIQYRQRDWSPRIQPWYLLLDIDSESDEEVQLITPADELPALPQ
eukprot:7554361-Heterocapsa_arctica.AAC.1